MSSNKKPRNKEISSAVMAIAFILIVILKYKDGYIFSPKPYEVSESQTQNVSTNNDQQIPETSAKPLEEASSAAFETTAPASPQATTVGEKPASNKETVEYHFKTSKNLSEHYKKHGIDMGFDSKEAYEKAASDVVNNPNALCKTEAEDGDYVYYIEDTNEFVIVSTEGFLRTYFLPDAGRKYFDRQ